MEFSVIIPVYNESKRIPKNIGAIINYFSGRDENIEIIFVNDGSTDATEQVLKDYQNQYLFKVISYLPNRGKGHAVRQGVLKAQGDWVLFFDIDLATPLVEFDHFKEFKTKDDQIVIGSRRLEGSNIAGPESFVRTFLGQGFTLISNILVPGIKDFTCGFKCFKNDVAKEIFSRAQIDRWGFDTEVLYIAKLLKLKIKQMPVRWIHDDDSRVSVLRDIFSSLRELIEMKSNQLKGKYK